MRQRSTGVLGCSDQWGVSRTEGKQRRQDCQQPTQVSHSAGDDLPLGEQQ